MLKINAIGTVRSCFKVKFGTPRQSQVAKHSKAYIEIDPTWDPVKALRGLEEFSHAWVMFWFHDTEHLEYRPIVHPPRLGRKGVGTLASRSPLRPNPIGLSLVQIDKIEKNRVYISGIDMIDGTPVLDIKPYIHAYDSVQGSRSGWLENLEDEKLEVEFTEEALMAIESLPNPNLKQNLIDILSADIRNRNDKHIKNVDKSLGFYYEDLNIVFKSSDTTVQVIRVEFIAKL